LREEFDRLHPPLFQRGEVSFHTFWITHIVLDSDRVNMFTIVFHIDIGSIGGRLWA
jgi:hypothetical protein